MTISAPVQQDFMIHQRQGKNPCLENFLLSENGGQANGIGSFRQDRIHRLHYERLILSPSIRYAVCFTHGNSPFKVFSRDGLPPAIRSDAAIGIGEMPTTSMFSWVNGSRNLSGRAGHHCFGHGGVTSPIMACARRMPMGPMIRSTVRLVWTMAFSPEAPRLAPAFSICAVAMALVPRATISDRFPQPLLQFFDDGTPIPPP